MNYRHIISLAALSASLQASAGTPGDPNWWQTPGYLPNQVSANSLKPVYVPAPDMMRWNQEGCMFGNTKVPTGSAIIPDNRSVWFVGPRCALEPLIAVTRDPKQPLDGPASRFNSARELITAIEDAEKQAATRSGNNPMQMNMFSINKVLKGEATAISGVGGLIGTAPGQLVWTDPGVSLGIVALKAVITGSADNRTPLVLTARGSTAPSASTAQSLTGEWWNRSGLLPTSPQGIISSGGVDANGNCRINQNSQPLVTVPAGSVVLTDTTRAFAVLAGCKVEPLVTLPTSSPAPATTSISGGGLRNPGNITTGQSPDVGQATMVLPFLAYPTAEAIVTGLIGMLGLEIYQTQQAQNRNGTVILPPNTGPELLFNRNAQGMSDTQIGGLIQDRNTIKPPGNCTDQEKQQLQNEVDLACKSQGARSCSPQTTPAPIAANNISKAMACIVSRQKINNTCYMGGNQGHIQQITQENKTIADCISAINRP